MDVSRALAPAWSWMVSILFRPFQWRVWLGLGFVSLMAASGGGGGHVNVPGNWGDSTPSGGGFPTEVASWFERFWPLVVVGGLVLIALWLLMVWLMSVFNMVLIDDVARRSAAIRAPFARLKGLGTSFFLWQLAFGFGMLFVILVPIGIGAALLIPLSHGGRMSGGIIAGLIVLGLLLIVMIIAAALVQFFTTSFVLVTMYVRNIRILAAWKAILPILRANAGQVALYTLLRIAFALGSAFVAIFAMIIALIVAAIPGAVVGVAVYFIWAAGGSAAHALAITLGVVLGMPIFMGLAWVMNILMLPVTVFLRAYSMTVLGQADPSLVTIPIGPASAQPPETDTRDPGVQGSRVPD